MQFCQTMLQETVGLLMDNSLPYTNSIIIGDNAAGKSEAIKQFMLQTKELVYFIDAVNRNFNVAAVNPLNDTIQFKPSILATRLLDENFNLIDTWSYYGTKTECIELLYPYFDKKLQSLLQEFLGVTFEIFSPEKQEVRYDFGEVGKLSNGYQAMIRIMLELLYFQSTLPMESTSRPKVVIDELDEYLSPKNAGRFYLFLKKHFAEMDFIVTIHSAEVIAAATKCNVIVMYPKEVELLDAGDFKDIDDVMVIFKGVFGKAEDNSKGEYEEVLRKLLNNRIAGVWGENEEKSYRSIDVNKLTKTQHLLYRQIGAW